MTRAAEVDGVDRGQSLGVEHRAASPGVLRDLHGRDMLKTGPVSSFAGDAEYGVFGIEFARDRGRGGMTAKTAANGFVVDGIA